MAGVHRRTWQLLGCRRTDSPHSRRDRLRLPSRCFTRNKDQGHCPSIFDACRAHALTVSGRAIASYSARSRSGCAHGRSGRAGSFQVDPRTHDHHTADSVIRDDGTARARTRAIHGKHRWPESCVCLKDGLSLVAHMSVEVHGVNPVDTPGRGRPCDGSRESHSAPRL